MVLELLLILLLLMCGWVIVSFYTTLHMYFLEVVLYNLPSGQYNVWQQQFQTL